MTVHAYMLGILVGRYGSLVWPYMPSMEADDGAVILSFRAFRIRRFSQNV